MAYFIDLWLMIWNNRKKVIPTIARLEELCELANVEEYVLKATASFGSGIGQKLMYVPSKYPNYPEPNLIELNEKEKILAKEFAKQSNLKTGFQRIDFLKLENDELLLLEIEDTAPHMSLEFLQPELRHKVINEYKENVYRYLEKQRAKKMQNFNYHMHTYRCGHAD